MPDSKGSLLYIIDKDILVKKTIRHKYMGEVVRERSGVSFTTEGNEKFLGMLKVIHIFHFGSDNKTVFT